MMANLNFSKNNLIAQANTLIEARYTITKNEQLLLFAMISLINPEDNEFLTFSVPYQHLVEILEIDKKSALRELEVVIARLMSRVIRINTPKGWKMYQWVSGAELKDHLIYLKFHDDLKPYLLALKKAGNFTQTRLGMVVHFKSVYTIRIYQLLKEYDSKKYTELEFSLDEFRQIMLGDKSKKYPLFKHFRYRVLDVAQNELGFKDPDTGLYKADLGFDLITRRTGRKISHLKFIIKKQPIKKKNQPIIDLKAYPDTQNKITVQVLDLSKRGLSIWANAPENKHRTMGKTDQEIIAMMQQEHKKRSNVYSQKTALESLIEYGLSHKIANKYITKYGEKNILATVALYQQKLTLGKVKDLSGGYLIQLLNTQAGQI